MDFFSRDKPTHRHIEFSKPEVIGRSIIENFEQTKDVIGITISEAQYNSIKSVSIDFLVNKKDVFKKREGFIHECHGDLHSGNIIIQDDKLCIFDCIEFNERFRFIDVASDLGFLAMDLDFLNHPYLSSYLITRYIEKSGDEGILDILNFYKSYRAYVRGKVLGFRLAEHLSEEERRKIIETASKYYRLSSYYASLVSINLRPHSPILFLSLIHI